MSKFKKLYRDFFGLNEQEKKPYIPTDDDVEAMEKFSAAAAEAGEAMQSLNASNDPNLEEAQLINNLTDYNGHVMYKLRDPQEANAVAKEIQRWTTKKGFTIISHQKSASGLTGYFYFRLGEDPGTESQKIQGYFAQLPELSKFAFQAPRSRKKPPARRMPPKRKI
jgi:hypothetical protein